MAATAEAVQFDEPSTLVRRAFDESPDVQTASATLEAWAKTDRALYDYLTGPYLQRACYEAARGICRSERRAVYTAPNYTQGGNGQRVHEHARSLLDFPLPGGIRLRDAKRADLEAAASFYDEQAADMASKARWLEAIAARVGRKKVGSVFDDEGLRALRE